jgi:proline iminopeptidase
VVFEMKRKFTYFIYICLACIMFICFAFWLYDRIVPSVAAEKACFSADIGYSCKQIGDFELSVYEHQLPSHLKNVPILLLHGGPGFSSKSILPHFKFLETTHALFTYDQRGAGFSESLPDLSNYQYEKLIDEVEVIRRDVIKSERIIVVGHSFGAYLALSYAARYPNHVEKSVLISTPLPMTDLGAIFAMVTQHIPSADQSLANKQWAEVVPKLFSTTFYKAENREKLIQTPSSYSVMVAVSQSLMKSLLFPSELRSISQPTLMIYGVLEIPAAVHERQFVLYSQLPNAKMIQMENSGHWSFIEEPELFQTYVESFLNSTGRTPAVPG